MNELRDTLNYDDLSVNDRKFMSIREKDKGNECFKAGENEEAVLYYSRSLALDDSSAIVYANRAMGNIRLSNFDQAVDDCSRSLEIDPTYTKALSRRGMVHHRCGRYTLAEKDFSTCLERNPSSKEFMGLLARSEQKRREGLGDARHQQTKKKIIIEETDSEEEEEEEEILELGTDGGFDISAEESKKKKKKEKEKKNIVEEAPPVSNIFKKVIIEDDSDSSEEEEEEKTAEAERTEGERANDLKTQGNQAMGKKDFNLAIALYTESLKLKKEAATYNNRCLGWLKLGGNGKEALADATSCLELDGGNVKARHRAGLAHVVLGDFEAAKRSFLAVLEIEPENCAAKDEVKSCDEKLAAAAAAAAAEAEAEGGEKKKINIVEDSDSSEDAEDSDDKMKATEMAKEKTEAAKVVNKSPAKALKLPANPPKSTSEMETNIRKLNKDPSGSFVVKYLASFKQAVHKKVFRETIPPELLVTIFIALKNQWESDVNSCGKVLISIAKVAPNFKMVMMLLEEVGKEALKEVIGKALNTKQDKANVELLNGLLKMLK